MAKHRLSAGSLPVLRWQAGYALPIPGRTGHTESLGAGEGLDIRLIGLCGLQVRSLSSATAIRRD